MARRDAVATLLIVLAFAGGYMVGNRYWLTYDEINNPLVAGPEEPPEEPPEKWRDLIEKALHAPSELERGNAFQSFQQQWQSSSDELIKAAGDENGPPLTRYYAVRLLALRRERAAIPMLIKNLDWEYRGFVTEVSYLTGYPCAKAIVEIGPECALDILADVTSASKQEMTDRKIWLRARVLESLYRMPNLPWGGDDAVGVVERYIERIPPGWEDARSQAGLLLEKLKAKDKRPTS